MENIITSGKNNPMLDPILSIGGLEIPVYLFLEGFHFPIFIPAMLVLIGGIVLRFIFVQAGQISHYIF